MNENILVIGCTQNASSAWLENGGIDLDRDGQFISIVLENLDGGLSSITHVLSDQNNISAVLIIEKDWLADQALLNTTQMLLNKISSHEDFRFYVFLADLSLQEFSKISGEPGAGIFGNLVDTVQLSQFIDAKQVVEQLAKFTKQHRKIRLSMFGKLIRFTAANLTIFFSATIQVACLAVTVGFFVLYFLKLEIPFFTTYNSVFAFASGVVVFPIIFYVSFILTNLAKSSNYGFTLLCGLGIIALEILIGKRISHESQIYIIGVVFGLIIEYLRRASYGDKRLLTKIDINDRTSKQDNLPAHVQNSIYGTSPNPFSCPIVAYDRPTIFLSYTRRSEWGKKLAAKLKQKFGSLQSESFLDVEDISAGSNWRQILNIGFGRANVFIGLIDNNSLGRDWPAAEIECALRQNGRYGIPRIIVLKNPNLDPESITNILPVFQEILQLSSEATTPLQPDIIEINDEEDPKIDMLVSQLRFPEFKTISVVMPYISALLESPFAFLNKPFGYLYIAGSFILWLPAALALLFPSVASFIDKTTSTSWNIPVLIILGFFLGAIIRDMFGLYFSFNLPFSKWRSLVFTLLGILYLLYRFFPHASFLTLGYTFIAICLGWMYILHRDGLIPESKKSTLFDDS